MGRIKKLGIYLGLFIVLILALSIFGFANELKFSAQQPVNFMLDNSQAKPTCDASVRAKAYTTLGSTGVADVTEVCVKTTLDVYVWKLLSLT